MSGARGSRLLILCYHSVSDDWPEVASVSPAALARQVRHLLRRGYVPRTLSAVLAGGAERRTLVVTFDDAFQSVLDEALPILAELDVPATLFVPTRYVDAGEPLAWSSLGRWLGTRWEDELRCMSWEGARRLLAAGWEIGSHTCTHPRLTELGAGSLEAELSESRQRCEEVLQRPCRSIAYPFGTHDERVVAATAAAGYAEAVTLGDRLLEPLRRGDLLRLSRQGVYRSTRWSHFLLATSPGLSRVRESAAFARLSGAPDR